VAIANTIDLIATALWQQGDIRDPLGVWGSRFIATGDATGGSIKTTIQAAAAIAGAYIYTCYSVNISVISQASAGQVKCRLLTNWPDIDPAAGVQGYSSHRHATLLGDSDLTEPISAPFSGGGELVTPNERFMLLFDPRPVVGAFSIVELEIGENVDTITYAFEAWGYYWDRSVLQAPGGPRHPGAS